MHLDSIDKKLLNKIQNDFPVVPEPYRKIGDSLGIDEAEVIKRLKRMKESGIIRRLGGIFDSRKLGYSGTLCAMKVPAQQLEQVTDIINSYPEVTHNYLREHEYNIWFTVLAESRERVKQIVNEISAKCRIGEILELPAERYYKIKVKFEVGR